MRHGPCTLRACVCVFVGLGTIAHYRALIAQCVRPQNRYTCDVRRATNQTMTTQRVIVWRRAVAAPCTSVVSGSHRSANKQVGCAIAPSRRGRAVRQNAGQTAGDAERDRETVFGRDRIPPPSPRPIHPSSRRMSSGFFRVDVCPCLSSRVCVCVCVGNVICATLVKCISRSEQNATVCVCAVTRCEDQRRHTHTCGTHVSHSPRPSVRIRAAIIHK